MNHRLTSWIDLKSLLLILFVLTGCRENIPYESITVEGNVVDTKGLPVPGVKVTCYRIQVINGEDWPFEIRQSITNSDGQYAFDVPRGLHYELSIGGKSATETRSDRFHAESDGSYQVDELIVHHASNQLTGTVTRSDGTPAAGLAFGYASKSFHPLGDLNLDLPKTSRTGEVSAPNILSDEPLAFWVIPQPNTVQFWRNIDPNIGQFQFELNPKEYVKLPSDWAKLGYVQYLALHTTNFPDNTIDFSLPDLSGKLVSLKDDRFKGKVVVVNFWGSWCGGCLLEIPELIKLKSKYENEGLEIVGIAFEEGPPDQQLKRTKKAVDRLQIDYTILQGGISDDNHVMQVVRGLEGFDGYPTTIFVDRNGEVADFSIGFSAHDDARKRFLVDALESKLIKVLRMKR